MSSNVQPLRQPGGLVLAHRDGPLLRLTLNNPPANALSVAMMEALVAALDDAAADQAVRAIVIRSNERVFSAGHDLKELTAHRADHDGGVGFFKQTFQLCAALMTRIVEHDRPVIAEVDGLATAAGCQLVASCDLAICTDSSGFCTPGVNIGLFCSTPMVALSRNVHRKQAMEMLLTGETIDASTAKEFGLVNRIVPRQYLNQVVEKYAQTIAEKSCFVVGLGKAAFYRQAEMTLADAYAHASAVMVENMMAADAEEGITAFLQKRPAKWTGK
ncbi:MULTISPECIES: enoyl-CoA hydratase [unclassified Roseitalea]|uniref:enoyl-CoA hydratase n=1 Tax=unclassified Roseitalea TaxID=2639107 RepID=UPI00273F216F|nr:MULTISPECIES: enoyl-CoA hydratase [unclassified Roseitalea]